MKSMGDFRLGQPVLLAAVFLVFTSLLSALAAPPVVSNVRASQRPGSEVVDIYYDLSDPDSSALTVTLLVSSDAGATWTVPAYTFTGAYGGGVSPGVNKYVVWNAGRDWDGQFTTQCRVRVIANDLDPEGFVTIPAGTFQMGDPIPDGDSNERPVHTVNISAFAIEKTEVDQTRWNNVRQYALQQGYAFGNVGAAKGGSHPIHTVSWFDAVKWCNARSQLDGRTPCYYTDAGLASVYKTGQTAPYVKWNANGYRLPTEAEWEKAARGGLVGQRFPWGMTITHNQANYYSSASYTYDISTTRGSHPNWQAGGMPYTSPGATFPPNGYSLYDMAGNVWEWCWDWYDSGWYGNVNATQTDTRGPAGPLGYRVLRGGAWSYDAVNSRCAIRNVNAPSFAHFSVGFRCVRGL